MSLTEARKALGVKPGADSKELKSRFRALARKHHPDHGGNESKFKQVALAYRTITNWSGTNIVAKRIEDEVFNMIWDEWFGTLTQENQNQVSEIINPRTNNQKTKKQEDSRNN